VVVLAVSHVLIHKDVRLPGWLKRSEQRLKEPGEDRE
jgi:hypothetical protein